MANAKYTYDSILGELDDDLTAKLKSLYVEIFKDADAVFFNQRLNEHRDLISILSYLNDKLVGFKIGYPYDEFTFYSWIGGVLPDHRLQGVGSRLGELQEKCAKKAGFVKLRTKSMNLYKPMMILNLKNDFNISKVYTNSKNQTKIVFEKDIT